MPLAPQNIQERLRQQRVDRKIAMIRELDKIKQDKEIRPVPLAAVIMVPGNEQVGTPPKVRDSGT